MCMNKTKLKVNDIQLREYELHQQDVSALHILCMPSKYRYKEYVCITCLFDLKRVEVIQPTTSVVLIYHHCSTHFDTMNHADQSFQSFTPLS
jgi:hypothetical protein